MTPELSRALRRPVAYRESVVETKAAKWQYEAAGRVLDLANIRERAAELGSQCFESVAKGELGKTLGAVTDREREIGLAFVRYAVHGRTDKD